LPAAFEGDCRSGRPASAGKAASCDTRQAQRIFCGSVELKNRQMQDEINRQKKEVTPK
jgi:hypothetical protein